MPFRRRYGMRRKSVRGPRKARRYRRRRAPGRLTYRATRAELKMRDQAVTYTLTAGAPTDVDSLVPIGVGQNESSRIGNSVYLKYVRCYFDALPTAVTATGILRISVLQDLRTVDSTAPAYTTAFDSASPSALLNRDQIGRFKVLYDRRFVIRQTNDQAGAHFIRSMFIPVNREIRWSGDTEASVNKNAIWLMLYWVDLDNSGSCSVMMRSRAAYIDA